MESNFLAELKASTAELHARVEQQTGIMEPEFELRDYIRLLRTFYAFYAPLERTIGDTNLPGLLPDWGERLKAEKLASDLAYFGATPSDSVCGPVAQHLDIAEAFGCQYVMEGATLGGQVIQRVLGPKLDIGDGRGMSFFHGYGKQTGEKWSSFRQTLQHYAGQDEKRRAGVIDGANLAFHGILACLTRETVR